MDTVKKAISSITPSKTTEETPKVELPKKETTPAGPGIVDKASDTAGDGVGKVAGATADAIGAGKDYAKLDTTQGVGKHVDQAETHVRSHETKSSPVEKVEGGVGGAVKGAGDFLKK